MYQAKPRRLVLTEKRRFIASVGFNGYICTYLRIQQPEHMLVAVDVYGWLHGQTSVPLNQIRGRTHRSSSSGNSYLSHGITKQSHEEIYTAVPSCYTYKRNGKRSSIQNKLNYIYVLIEKENTSHIAFLFTLKLINKVWERIQYLYR